ncbi:MAG TPA: holo-ACP synthase [Lactobacillaceae bacterium]|jgi:holo-[acyl-carrier protein] synthase
MIIGFGNDIESISRINALLERKPQFFDVILTPAERAAAAQRNGKHYVEFLAGRFSAKEAYAKAVGTGIGAQAHWQDIEVLNTENGRPVMTVKNNPHRLHVAISHSGDLVNTSVIIEQLEDAHADTTNLGGN